MEDTPSQIVEKAAETAADVVKDAKGAAQVVLDTAAEVAHALEISLNDHLRDEAMYREAQQKEQSAYREQVTKSLASIHERLGAIPTKEDFDESLSTYFKTKGKAVSSWLVGASIVIGALAVIFGGLKTLLATIGIAIVHKP